MLKRLIVIATVLALWLPWPPARAADGGQSPTLYDQVRGRIAEKYGGRNFDSVRWLREVPPIGTDVPSLLSSLGDHAVRLLSPDEARRFFAQMQSRVSAGAGLLELLCIDHGGPDGRLTVITPIPGTPAAQADLRSGDVIVEIGGVHTGGMSLHQAANALQGEEGSPIALVVERRGISLEKRMRAAAFPTHPVVRSSTLEMGGAAVGYLGLLRFDAETAADVERRLVEFRAAGIDALVLDLRNNPGGAIHEAIAVTELFLRDGDPIATLHGRGETLRTFQAGRDPVIEVPVAVLVNAGTASAAEVVAGALQAHQRGRLFGERSAGKGLVHGAETLSDGAVLMLPVGRLVTPHRVDILGTGVTPDVGLPDTGTPVVHSIETTKGDRLLWQAVHAMLEIDESGAAP